MIPSVLSGLFNSGEPSGRRIDVVVEKKFSLPLIKIPKSGSGSEPGTEAGAQIADP